MRRFLFLALGMGFLLPTAASAETWWLMAGGHSAPASAYATCDSWSIPTSSLAECEAAGQVFISHSWKRSGKRVIQESKKDYVCVKGK